MSTIDGERFCLIWTRAPLLAPTVAFMVGIVAAEAAARHIAPTWAPAVGLIAIGAALLAVRRKRVAQAVGLLFVAGAAGWLNLLSVTTLPANHVAHLTGGGPRLTRVVGLVCSQPVTRPPQLRNPFTFERIEPRTTFVLQAMELRTTGAAQPLSGRIRIHINGPPVAIRLGDDVELTCWLYGLRGARNPGETDWRRSGRLEQIYAGATTDSQNLRVTPGRSVLRGWVARARAAFAALLLEPYGGADAAGADLLQAMVLGQRSIVPPEVNEAFLRVGAIHVLSVGGFHIALLSSAIWGLLRWIPRVPERAAALASLAATLAYALLAEPNAPVARAALMAALLFSAQLLRRPVNVWNWLACSALLILTVAPLELFRPGFQLSFVQVAAIVGVAAPLYRAVAFGGNLDAQRRDAATWTQWIWRQAWRGVLALAITSLVAWLVSAPLVIWHFGKISLWAPLLTIVVTPLLVLVTLLAFGVLGAALIATPLAAALGAALSWLTGTMMVCVNALALFSGPPLECPIRWAIPLFALGCGALTLALWPCWPPLRGWLARLGVAAASVAIGVAGLIAEAPQRSTDALQVHMLDVGAGSAALLITPERKALMIDLGTIANYDVGQLARRALVELGLRRLESLAVSHDDFDHFSGLPTLAGAIPIAAIRVPPLVATPAATALANALRQSQLTPITITAGQSFALGEVRIDALWPPAELGAEWSDNDRSLVLRVSHGARSVLFPGDIEGPAMAELLRLFERGLVELRSDVLIAPHHGSVRPAESGAFLAAVAPVVVVASSGEPRPGLSALISERLGPGTRLFVTHQHGAIEVAIRDGAIRVQTPWHEGAE